MLALTSDNVEKVFHDCLFVKGEDTTNAKIVEGVVSRFGFNPVRLEKRKAEIGELLAGLPDEFQGNSGGGWSFLNACMTRNGDQWGEHRNIEQLLVLGLATHQVEILIPREAWKFLPGGMPYFSVIGQNKEAKPDEPASDS